MANGISLLFGAGYDVSLSDLPPHLSFPKEAQRLIDSNPHGHLVLYDPAKEGSGVLEKDKLVGLMKKNKIYDVVIIGAFPNEIPINEREAILRNLLSHPVHLIDYSDMDRDGQKDLLQNSPDIRQAMEFLNKHYEEAAKDDGQITREEHKDILTRFSKAFPEHDKHLLAVMNKKAITDLQNRLFEKIGNLTNGGPALLYIVGDPFLLPNNVRCIGVAANTKSAQTHFFNFSDMNCIGHINLSTGMLEPLDSPAPSEWPRPKTDLIPRKN